MYFHLKGGLEADLLRQMDAKGIAQLQSVIHRAALRVTWRNSQ